MPLIRVCAVNATAVDAGGAATGRPSVPTPSATMLLPSGVSSDRDASTAASASWASVTPGAGRNAVACRLPWVIVPVLSSRRMSTSPAASTARPLVAITLAWIIRSMPAIPIADRSPPIVVGIRHTRSATRTVSVTVAAWPPAASISRSANAENGYRVTVTSRKTMVSPASRMSSAISLGVFFRLAPSTIAIIRSRNEPPGPRSPARSASRTGRSCRRSPRCGRRRSRGRPARSRR